MTTASKIEQIKEATDGTMLLESLGFYNIKHNYNELRCACRVHGGDNPTAFSFRVDLGRWKCFTHKCEMQGGIVDNDVISLVQKVNGVGFKEALEYLAALAGIDIGDESPEGVNEFLKSRDRNNFIKTVNRISKRERTLRELSENTVAGYIRNRTDYFLKHGFMPSTLDTFEIGSLIDREGVQRATVPIRDHLGRLVSISARREDNDNEPRYKLSHKFEKSKVIYNLHRAIKYGGNTLIIVEGFKALWAVYEAGYYNVGAVMGSSVVKEQALLLIANSPFTNCLLLLDGDSAGKEGTVLSMRELSRGFKVIAAPLPDGMAPDSAEISRRDLKDFIKCHLELF